MKPFIFIFLLVFCTALGLQAGGPWPAGKNKGYFQLGASLNKYDRLIVPSSSPLYNKRLLRYVVDNTVQIYGEYGVTEKFTLVTAIPLKLLSTGSAPLPNGDAFPAANLLPAGSLTGLGNIMLTAKYTFYNKGLVFAGQLQAEAPTFSRKESIGLRTGYDTWVACPGISVGASTKKLYGFADVGYALRTGDYSNELRYNAEIGGRFIKKTWLALAFNNKKSFKNVERNEGNVAQTAMYVNNQSYNAFGLKIAYAFTDNIGINLSAFGAFGGENVAAAPTFNAGVYYKW